MLAFFVATSPLSAQEGSDTLRVVRPLEGSIAPSVYEALQGKLVDPVYDPLRPVTSETSDEVEQLTEENFFDYFTVSAVSAWQNPIERLSRNLIFMRYRPRGYDNRFNRLTVNGADLGDLSEGYFYWKLISGARGVFYSDDPRVAGWGAIGQSDRIETAPGATPSSGKLLYAHANRIYANRVAASGLYNPGKGTSFSIAADRRWGEDGFSEGLFTDLTALSANFEFSGRGHSLNLFYTGTFGEQGVRSAATQEVFDLAGSPWYNANWGEQDGRMRNAKVRSYGQNLAVASYRFDASEQLQFRATAAYLFGPTATSYLTWYDAPTAYPDYYRYLPSFFGNPAVADPLREAWAGGDLRVTQIDWARIYETNALAAAGGDARSHYILREMVSDKGNLQGSAAVTYRPDRNWTLDAGAEVRLDRSDNFSRVADLLGGTYWTDIDQYLIDDDYYADQIENDLRHPGRRVGEGDRFGYNYLMHARATSGWARIAYNSRGWSGWLSAEAGSTAYQRDGQYEEETFPGAASYGKSGKYTFQTWGAQLSVARNFSLNHQLGLRVSGASVAPLVEDLFVAPMYRNAVAPQVKQTQVAGGELFYSYVVPHLIVKANAYATLFRDGSDITSYYDDLKSVYANLIMTGIEKLHAGVEAGVDWATTNKLTLTAAVELNRYTYESDPRVTLLADRDGAVIVEDAPALLKGFYLSSTPQQAGLVQARYTLPGWWYVTGSVNYAGGNYVWISPVRRMTRTLDRTGSPEAAAACLAQEKLNDAVTLNLMVSKNFRLRNGSQIGIWINVENLLNNENIRTSGYEQMRFSKSTAAAGSTLMPFRSKYYYAYGTNYYASISYTF